jgi:hypothetical protein
MLKYWSIKKYGNKLQQRLENKFGGKSYYTPSEVRSTVYKCNFSPKYLPLGYILYLEHHDLLNILNVEFPEIDPVKYKEEILTFLDKKSYQGSIQRLSLVA